MASYDGGRVVHQSVLASGSSDNPTGDVHKRHRSVIAPFHGRSEPQSWLQYFVDIATSVSGLHSHLTLRTDADPRQIVNKRSAIIEKSELGYPVTIGEEMWFGMTVLGACALASEPGLRGFQTDRKIISQESLCRNFRA